MRKAKQGLGFTLIESLIVLAIVGVFGVLVIPAYQDYAIRSMVREGPSLARPALMAMGMACNDGRLNAAATQTGTFDLPPSNAISGKYVSSVVVEGHDASSGNFGRGTITINFNSVIPEVANKTIIYFGVCNASGIHWSLVGSIPPKYLPKLYPIKNQA